VARRRQQRGGGAQRDGSDSLAVVLWRRQLDGGSLAEAAWRPLCAMAAAAWRWRGGGGGGGGRLVVACNR